MAEILAIFCFCILVYTFAVYPLTIYVLSRFFKKPVAENNKVALQVCVIIAAYNEELFIEDAVRSVYRDDYPHDLLKVMVGSDGSTDGTAHILSRLQSEYPDLEVHSYPRMGKNNVLNGLSKKAAGDILLYMDADCRINRGAIRNITAKFGDPAVGAVIARMSSQEESNAGGAGEILYQKYETIMRVGESNVASTVNSLGALYGIRRDLWQPLPNDMVCDDYTPILNVALAGKRVIFDGNSSVREVRGKSLSGEFGRRIRMTAGGMAAVWDARALLKPRYGWVSYFLWSHKVIRWLSPVFLIGLLISTALMPSGSTLFIFFAAIQVILFSGGLAGWILKKYSIGKLFRFQVFFLTMNIGFLLGIYKFLQGTPTARWERP